MPDAYEYFTAPANSFGIKEAKFIKWPYFWNLLHNNAVWQMEGWNPVTEEWQDNYEGTNLNNWLDIDLAPNEDGSQEKITLSFTSPYTTKYRFGFAFNLRVKQYIDNSGNHQYTLTIPTSDDEEDEEYEIIFDWSDVVPLIQTGTITVTHGIKEVGGKNYFWVKLTGTSNLAEGNTFVIDPWFGSQAEGGTIASIEDTLYSSYVQMAAVDSIANSITVRIATGTYAKGVKCAIYDSSLNKIAETESISALRDIDWYTFEFDIPPELTASAWYYICVLGDGGSGNNYGYYATSGGWGVWSESESYPTIPATLGKDSEKDSNGIFNIYCTYTEISGEETSPVKVNKVQGKFVKLNKVSGRKIKIG